MRLALLADFVERRTNGASMLPELVAAQASRLRIRKHHDSASGVAVFLRFSVEVSDEFGRVFGDLAGRLRSGTRRVRRRQVVSVCVGRLFPRQECQFVCRRCVSHLPQRAANAFADPNPLGQAGTADPAFDQFSDGESAGDNGSTSSLNFLAGNNFSINEQSDVIGFVDHADVVRFSVTDHGR